mgnify:CR=1 FL=1
MWTETGAGGRKTERKKKVGRSKRMNEWMNECMNEWSNGGIKERKKERTHLNIGSLLSWQLYKQQSFNEGDLSGVYCR